MSAPSQFQRARMLAQGGPGRSRCASGLDPQQSGGAHGGQSVDAYLAALAFAAAPLPRLAQVPQCRRRPEAVAAIRRSAPSALASQLSDGILSYLAGPCAVVRLSSEAPLNRQMVAGVFTGSVTGSHGQVRPVDAGWPGAPGDPKDEAPRPPGTVAPAPNPREREVIAIHLGGRRHPAPVLQDTAGHVLRALAILPGSPACATGWWFR